MKRFIFILMSLLCIIHWHPIYQHQEFEYFRTVTTIDEVYGATNNVSVQILEESKCSLSDNDIYLIALVTMAEAEGECEEGKRLVIDTILNRVDSLYFPNTVYDVVYQPSQFSSMSNGRCNRVTVTDEVCEIVREEAKNRTNTEVIFFNANHYSAYGTEMFQLGNHYFSSY